jgi:hypothetical protein
MYVLGMGAIYGAAIPVATPLLPLKGRRRVELDVARQVPLQCSEMGTQAP